MDIIKFHKITTKELKAIQDRIECLVPNWLEVGMYREAVLRGIIRNFLPKNFDVASGYVARQTNNRGSHEVSPQIDIIIYNNNFPILFKKEELVVVTADSVGAIIEVKSNDRVETLKKTLTKCNKIGRFIFNGKYDKSIPLFNGIFYYNLKGKTDIHLKKTLTGDPLRDSKKLEPNKYVVDHISFGEDKFYKFWKKEIITESSRNYLYKMPELSFSFFISNLISYIQYDSVVNNNFLWFPTDKSFKDRSRLWEF
ncbi:MAG: DUF6602 domain-containing protein [Chitinophagaceae bacterium]